MYCRVDLTKTKYKEIQYEVLDESYFDEINEIYKNYCKYKGFDSAMPLFIEDIQQTNTEILGYRNDDKLIAFSLILLYPSKQSVTADQFAWDWKDPGLKLGYKSIRSECARYKRLGYNYFYLGDYYDYKAELAGFEISKPFK